MGKESKDTEKKKPESKAAAKGEKAEKSKKSSGKKDVEFTLYAPEAREVYLAGDFNQWDTRSTPMKKKDGQWKAKLKLPPGTSQYKFFVDGAWVQNVPDAEAVPNPYGTKNFIVRVEGK